MPKFLHTADWQIGRQFSQFPPEDAASLSEARIEAVARIARLASEREVDAVLVAGDVFDAQTVSERTIRRLFNAIAAFAGPWIMIPGNHDAALSESVWTRALRLGAVPGNAFLLLKPEPVEFAAGNFVVLPAPLTQRHAYGDLTEWFDHAETAPGLARIGLAHGSAQGVLDPDIDSTNPIAADRAERARLSYLALGDWHGCKRIDERTWYSGTPEADRFRNNEPGDVLLVETGAEGAAPSVTRSSVGKHRWSRHEQTLGVASDIDALIDRLAALETDDVLLLRLAGSIDLAGMERIRGAIGLAEARCRGVRAELDQLRLQPTADDIAALAADGYLANVLTELHERQQGEQAQVATHALALLAGILRERGNGKVGA